MAAQVRAPERLKAFKRAIGIAAAVLLTGAPALGADPIPVREMPPSPPPDPNWALRQRGDAGTPELLPETDPPKAKAQTPDAGVPEPKPVPKKK